MKATADSIMAATHRLVQQAMAGDWEEIPQTVQERRELLDSLSASVSPQDQQWLSALRQAMAESDAAVAQMTAQVPAAESVSETVAASSSDASSTALVDSMMEMLKTSR